MPEVRSTEAPKVPRSKWILQLHRKPVRWDVLMHKLSEQLARRYWYTQVHFQQEILRLEADELWDASIQMARAFGKQTTLAAVREGEPSLFSLSPTTIDAVVDSGTRSAMSAVINYLEIAHNCFLKRNHPDLELLTPRIAEAFRRFIVDKLSPAGELHPCLENPIGSDEGYFPDSRLPADPQTSSGNAAIDAYRLNLLANDNDDARAVLRKLVAFVKTDPFLAPEFTVETVTKLAARQMQAAKENRKINQTTEAIHIRDRFIFTPSRQGGLSPVQLFLDQQLLASEQQRARLHRWAEQNTDGMFRVAWKDDRAVTLRDIASDREVSVVYDALFDNILTGMLVRIRVLPWDDQWLVSGAAQIADEDAFSEQAFKAMLHPLRVHRRADEDDPRLLAARELVKIIHAQFVSRLGSELATFESLDACRAALADLHHHLTIELNLPDGRQFADAWQQDVGLEFPPYLHDQFAAGESNLTTPGVIYDLRRGMAFLPNAQELTAAMTSASPTLEQKQAFARLLLEKWRPGWIIERLASEYPGRIQAITRELLGDPSFTVERDLEPLLGRLKCPDHTLPDRPVPFLVS